jgi:Tfp pilus assembly protein PilF
VERGDELMARNVGRAREMYEAAIAVRPSGAEASTGLGYVMLEIGNPAGAVTRFQPAANQGYAEAFIGLGDAYRRLGRNDAAVQAYRDYLSRLPNGQHSSIARRWVDELGSTVGNDTGGGDTGGSGDTGGGDTGGGDTGGGTTPAPSTAPDELPAPRGATTGSLPGPDTPAVGSEH